MTTLFSDKPEPGLLVLRRAVRKTLSERTHVCPHCKAILDRDYNAARNILALGLRYIEETTAGHAERNAWGPSALYPPRQLWRTRLLGEPRIPRL